MKLACVKIATVKYVYIGIGVLSVALGSIGIVVPLLPTTPFLLLAVFCFARSSDSLQQWLLNHRLFGPYLRNYYDGTMTRAHKVRTLALLWIGLMASAFFIGKPVVWAIFVLLGAAVTTHIVMLKAGRSLKPGRKAGRNDVEEPEVR